MPSRDRRRFARKASIVLYLVGAVVVGVLLPAVHWELVSYDRWLPVCLGAVAGGPWLAAAAARAARRPPLQVTFAAVLGWAGGIALQGVADTRVWGRPQQDVYSLALGLGFFLAIATGVVAAGWDAQFPADVD